MKNAEFQSKKTKIQAYRLIHDKSQLFCLLFLKYGLTTRDFFISFINQLLFKNYSHYTIIYKESLLNNLLDEFVKKLYKYDESRKLIIKINKYNQNYFRFFSKPIFSDFYFNKFIGSFYDNKAEVFYINNYSGKKNSKILKEHELKTAIKNNISTLDNDTINNTIFNKRIRKMIDKNLESRDITISLSVNTKKDFNKSTQNNISNSSISIFNNFINNNISKINNSKNISNNKLLDKNMKNLEEKKILLDNSDNKINNKYIFSANNLSLYLNKNNNSNNNTIQIQNKKSNNDNKKVEKIISYKKDTNKRNNYIEINNPRIINSNNNKSVDKNNINIKKFSQLYKKPKIIIYKNYDKKELSKNTFSRNQISILSLNTLKKSPKKTKFNFYSPQNNKNKYLFNNLINVKTPLLKNVENAEFNKEISISHNTYINGKSEFKHKSS